MTLFEKALFIFRRDLRLEDNTALLFALENSKTVIPAFIFTQEQILDNPYRSDHCLQFMIESLEDLDEALKKKDGRLFLFFDTPAKVIAKCVNELGIEAVIVNSDYTPYSIARDKKIRDVCENLEIAFHSFEDALLHPLSETLKRDGKPYTVFTPFYRNALELDPPRHPLPNRHTNYYSRSISFAENTSIYKTVLPTRSKKTQKGGRKEALSILKNLKKFSNYQKIRDFPAQEGTTHLSPHLKFTTCSAREIYHALREEGGINSPLIRSLYWRDFFTSIAFHFPRVFKGPFQEKFDRIPWSYSKANFNSWCEGKTGFPIVDAGMREMNQTGFMHNRVRMLAGAFLVKDLHINWKWGEKYFAQMLIDYDPAVNNGNWQWVASTGCDAQPYFRIFNPWIQQKKFDPDCLYIKRWIPELSSLPPSVIHNWHLEKNYTQSSSYPEPMVDHGVEAKIALESF